jgi:hypothetical protein
VTSPFPEIQTYIDNNLTHAVHTSERRAFRACRRRWDWAYRQNYHPNVPVPPLEFGIAFHKAMEHFYEPRTWLSPLEVKGNLALVAFRQECEEQMRKYQRDNPDPDVEVLDDYRERIKLGLGMLKYYCWEVSPVYDRNWTPIRVEISFEVPIKHQDTGEQLWCKCDKCWRKYYKSPMYSEEYRAWRATMPNDLSLHEGEGWYTEQHRKYYWDGLPVTYGGRLDMLAQDEHGRYWIVDWKTTKAIIDEDAQASFLQLDDQISSYVWALTQYGIEVAGFVYVEIKKAYPAPPTRMKRTREGRAFSTSKTELTRYDEYLTTIQKQDYDAWQMGLYDNHLNWLKSQGPVFTQRHQIHKNAHEIANTGRYISMEALDIISNPSVYPQPGRFSCNWCMFQQPCLGVNMGEDYQYTLDTMFEKQDRLYYEEKPPTTE